MEQASQEGFFAETKLITLLSHLSDSMGFLSHLRQIRVMVKSLAMQNDNSNNISISSL